MDHFNSYTEIYLLTIYSERIVQSLIDRMYHDIKRHIWTV